MSSLPGLGNKTQAEGLGHKSMWDGLRSCIAALRGIIDELSDKAPYQRHLAAHGATDSPVEWRRFQDKQWQARQRRGRCC